MSKITAEIEIKQTRISDAIKGVARQIDIAFAPMKRGAVATKMLGNSLAPITNIASGVVSGVTMVGAAALAAGAGIAVGVKKALDMGGALNDLAERTGILPASLMVMQQAFVNSGLAAEQVGPAVSRMQKALTGANEDGEKTASMFERLGLNMSEMQGMKPDEQFKATAAAISQLTDPSERAAASMGIFGKSGAEMLALFNDPAAFGSAAAQVGTQAQLMDRNTALFDDISDKLALAGLKMQGFFVGVADQVAPVLQPLLDWFASQDLAAQGQAFGQAIASAITMLTDGTFGQTLVLAAENAGMAFANWMISGVEEVIRAFRGLGGVTLARWDRSGVEAQIAANVSQSVNKVYDARATADATPKKEGFASGLGDKAAPSGNKVSLSRMFSTSGGLFVKDPLLAESRRQSDLLEKINTGIGNLKSGGQPQGLAGGASRFSL